MEEVLQQVDRERIVEVACNLANIVSITGEEDAPIMRKEATQKNLSPICSQLQVVGLAESGHDPMLEMPPRTVWLVERFLGA